MENEKRIDGIYKKEVEQTDNIDVLEDKRHGIMNKWQKNNYLLNIARMNREDGRGDKIDRDMRKMEKEMVALNSRIQELKLKRDTNLAEAEKKEVSSLSTTWNHNEAYMKLLKTKADILKSKHILGDDGEDYRKWKEYTDKIKLVEEKQKGIEDRLEQMAEKLVLNK